MPRVRQHSARLIVFGLLAALLLAGETLGWLANGLAPTAIAGLLCESLTALLAAAGMLLMDRFVLMPMRAREAALASELRDRAEGFRQLRHDLRGALSPALLTVDRLLTDADPSIRRVGEMTLRAIERASALLSERDEEGQKLP